MKNVQKNREAALIQSMWATLSYWLPFRYAINWHPDQIRTWFGLLGIETANMEAGWQGVMEQLEQEGWIRLAQPSFSRHIWQLHPLLMYRLSKRSMIASEMWVAFFIYYNGIAEHLHGLLVAPEKEKREAGLILGGWERYNLQRCLFHAMETGVPFGRLFTVLFMYLSMMDRLDQALELCQRVMTFMTEGVSSAAQTTERKIEWMGVLDAVGRTLRELGNFEEAARFFREMDELYQQHEQLRQVFPVGWAEIKLQSGALSIKSGALHEGKARLDEAMALLQKNGNLKEVALVEEHFSQYYYGMGDLESALVAIEKTRQQAESDCDEIRLVNALQIKAGILYALGHRAESRQLYKECLDMGQHLGQLLTIAKAHQGIGLLESTSGRFRESLTHYRAALETLLRMPANFSFDIAQIYYNMANDCYHLGYYAESEEYYGRALAAYEKLGISDKAAEISQNLANVWYYLGDMAKSTQFDIRAANIFAASGRVKELREIMENTVQLARELGDPSPLRKLVAVMQKHLPEQTCLDLLAEVEQKILQSK
jgi:tetratricopeptide (TPR) repeat protein